MEQNQERERCVLCEGEGNVRKSYNPHEQCPGCEGEGFVPPGGNDWLNEVG